MVLVFELGIVLDFRGVVVHQKVKDTNGVHRRETIVPIAPLGLFLDRKAGVVDTAVFEVELFDFLQLDDKAFAAFADAMEVKDGFAVGGVMPWYSFLL